MNRSTRFSKIRKTDTHTDRRDNFIEVEFSFSVNSSVRLGGYCTVFRCRWATMYTDWLTEIAEMNIDGRRKTGVDIAVVL